MRMGPGDLRAAIDSHDYLLAEAAVIETLRRESSLSLHPRLENALLIYDERGRRALSRLYQSFITVARRAGRPLLISTPTWRANRDRLEETAEERDVNVDAVRFLQDLRKRQEDGLPLVFIGGLIGCKNDCYRPEEALSAGEAEEFHGWQVRRLAGAGVDFLLAATLPALSEAMGIARAMEGTGLPYMISFVIGSGGRILDGSDLDLAFGEIDRAAVNRPPLGYMINCAYPSFLHPGDLKGCVAERLVGFQGNASSMDHAELERSETLQVDDVHDWAGRMVQLNRRHGVKILGGCCGTGVGHLEEIVKGMSGASRIKVSGAA